MEQTLIGLGVVSCKDVKNRLLHLYLNLNERFYEYLVKASLGVAQTVHDSFAVTHKKSLCQMKSFRTPLTRKD